MDKKKKTRQNIKLVAIIGIIILLFGLLVLYFVFRNTISSNKINIDELNNIATDQIEKYNLENINFIATRGYSVTISINASFVLDESIQENLINEYKNIFLNGDLEEQIINKYYSKDSNFHTISVELLLYVNDSKYRNSTIK